MNPANATILDIPVPEGGIKNNTTRTHEKAFSTQVANTKYSKSIITKSPGEVTKTISASTTITTNDGIPVTVSASQSSSSSGPNTATGKVSVGPKDFNLFIKSTVLTTNGKTAYTTTVGAAGSAETPVVNGNSLGLPIDVEKGIKY